MMARLLKGAAAAIGTLVVLTFIWHLAGESPPPAVPFAAFVAGWVTWYVT